MYANGLQMLQEQQSSKLQEFENVDWEALKTEDPYQYMLKKDEYRDAQEKVQNVATTASNLYNKSKLKKQQSQSTFCSTRI